NWTTASSSSSSATLCSAGYAPSGYVATLNNTTPSASWSCAGYNGGMSSYCNATLTVNGACGPSSGISNGIPVGSSNLCSTSGTTPIISGGSGGPSTPWTWTCSGVNGGQSTSCSAVDSNQAKVNPYVESLSVANVDCINSGSGACSTWIGWTYVDGSAQKGQESDCESRYQLQVSTNADYSSPVIDYTTTDLSSLQFSNHRTNNSQILTTAGSSTNPIQDTLAFNQTYYWRVQAYDCKTTQAGCEAGYWDSTVKSCGTKWMSGQSFTTASHAYPTCNFSATVSAPLVNNLANNVVTFADSSICYAGSTNIPGSCSSAAYTWSFGDGTGGSAVGSTSHNYANITKYPTKETVTLKICDDVGCCTASTNVVIKTSQNVPTSKEISPY
ncbi:MAG: PKD domain-containing protein, partial [Candidatus Staskawiczbacteria bacterium]|nr:PKD domain-containing protein [Candidatus Staskawiczbacteria bacterium]